MNTRKTIEFLPIAKAHLLTEPNAMRRCSIKRIPANSQRASVAFSSFHRVHRGYLEIIYILFPFNLTKYIDSGRGRFCTLFEIEPVYLSYRC